MAPTIPVYLEIGRRRSFAAALHWPGWCRSGRDADAAMDALASTRTRYARSVGRRVPSGELEVVERLPGDATTDFGAPGAIPSDDREPLTPERLDELVALLRRAGRRSIAPPTATAAPSSARDRAAGGASWTRSSGMCTRRTTPTCGASGAATPTTVRWGPCGTRSWRRSPAG